MDTVIWLSVLVCGLFYLWGAVRHVWECRRWRGQTLRITAGANAGTEHVIMHYDRGIITVAEPFLVQSNNALELISGKLK